MVRVIYLIIHNAMRACRYRSHFDRAMLEGLWRLLTELDRSILMKNRMLFRQATASPREGNPPLSLSPQASHFYSA